MTKKTDDTKRTSGDPRDDVVLAADGRHWIAVSGVSRFGGFGTEDDARRFLDNLRKGVPIISSAADLDALPMELQAELRRLIDGADDDAPTPTSH
jgi:hypothetical protein